MPLDLQSSWTSGGTVLAGVLYVAASLYVTGPLVGERTIARSGWEAQCRELKVQELTGAETPHPVVPKFDCRSVLGWFGDQGHAFCDRYTNPNFNLPGLDELEAHRQRQRAFQQERLARELAQGGRCACAATLTLERHRTSFALYAGSARMVTPAAIRNLSAELQASFNARLCAPASAERGAS